MSRLGDFDFDGLKEFKKGLDQLNGNKSAFFEDCIKELAARLIGKTIAKTPVGRTGDLKKGWTIGHIQRSGSEILIEVINPVEYALYVEYGHRTRDHKGWVEGRFMLTKSIEELESELPAILERKMEQFLKKHLRW